MQRSKWHHSQVFKYGLIRQCSSLTWSRATVRQYVAILFTDKDVSITGDVTCFKQRARAGPWRTKVTIVWLLLRLFNKCHLKCIIFNCIHPSFCEFYIWSNAYIKCNFTHASWNVACVNVCNANAFKMKQFQQSLFIFKDVLPWWYIIVIYFSFNIRRGAESTIPLLFLLGAARGGNATPHPKFTGQRLLNPLSSARLTLGDNG